jgi:hypothetical protein
MADGEQPVVRERIGSRPWVRSAALVGAGSPEVAGVAEDRPPRWSTADALRGGGSDAGGSGCTTASSSGPEAVLRPATSH